jgi:hypothetical protein
MTLRTTRNIIFVLILAYAVLLVGVRWYTILGGTDEAREEFVENDLAVITVVNPDAPPLSARYTEEECALPWNTEEAAWQAYSNSEKMEILQQVTAHEAQELGCPVPTLQETDLEDRVLANYDRTNNVINIDRSHLENDLFTENLNSVLHETRHAYQHELRDMLDLILETAPAYAELALLRKVKQLKENQEAYQSGLLDFENYKSQPIEVDARFYASNRLKQLQAAN